MAVIRDTDRNAHKFFQLVQDTPRVDDLSLIVVMHLVPWTRIFFEHLERLARIAVVLPKPKSQDDEEHAYFRNKYTLKPLNRASFQDPDHVLQLVEQAVPSGRFVIMDIGGYFAPHIEMLSLETSRRLLGVVEDTENGHRRYAALNSYPVPVVSVARSELKNSEDFLVGQSIVFAAERLMRDFGSIMSGRKATVIGYGKIGRSIAQHLHNKHLSTVIVESNPIRAIEAKAHGFHVIPKIEAITRGNLVFCATGNKCISGDEFERLNNGSYVISVTSVDDELDLSSARATFQVEQVSQHIEHFSRMGHFFYLLANGNAVNFAIDDRGRLGPFIFPVQAELLVAARYLATTSSKLPKKLITLPEELKVDIAAKWEKAYATVNAP